MDFCVKYVMSNDESKSISCHLAVLPDSAGFSNKRRKLQGASAPLDG